MARSLRAHEPSDTTDTHLRRSFNVDSLHFLLAVDSSGFAFVVVA
jgi:hypothetical protein